MQAQRETPLRYTFFAIDVAVGRHILSSDADVPAFIDIGGGDESFVRLSWPQKIGPPTLVLEKAPAVVARKEVRFVVYIDPKEVVSTSVPKTDPRVTQEPHFKQREVN